MKMMIEFAFAEEIKKSSADSENYKLDGIRGISYPSLGKGYLNLSIDLWKRYDNDTLIEQLTKTLTHEYVHLIIGTKATPDTEPEGYTWKGEEKVVRLMAGQPYEYVSTVLLNEPKTKRKF